MHPSRAAQVAGERRPIAPWVCWSVVTWLVAITAWYVRGSLWVLDLAVIPLRYLAVVLAIVLTVATVVRSGRRVLFAVVVPVMLLVSGTFVGWWQLAPRAWFATHRPLFDQVRTVDPGSSYYGNDLPLPYRFLSQTGQVSAIGDDGLFFPQWVGIPDDAGGYLYRPSGSPAGSDLYGSVCARPTDLGGGWWMCNL